MITLYSTGCPKCRVLEKKMNQKGIDFTIVDDPKEITLLGYTSVPVLKVGNEYYEFVEANRWINEQ